MKFLFSVLVLLFANVVFAYPLTQEDFQIYEAGTSIPTTGNYSVGAMEIIENGENQFAISVPVTANAPEEIQGGFVSIVTRATDLNSSHSVERCETLNQQIFMSNSNHSFNFFIWFPLSLSTENYVVQAYAIAYKCNTFIPPILYSNIVEQRLRKPSEELDLSLQLTLSPTGDTDSGYANVKPDVPISFTATLSGTGISAQEAGSATVVLEIGETQQAQSILLSDIRSSGTASLHFTHTFSASDAGRVNIKAYVLTANDSNPSNNSVEMPLYVLCSVRDKGVVPKFFSQADVRWRTVGFGNQANSKAPGSIRKYGCSLSAFAMLMTAYGIENTPLGSPDGGSNKMGIRGEEVNPLTLNGAFINYKTKFTGKASVALNNSNDPVWEGMAEVARGGYRAMCTLKPQKNCNPKNATSAISYKGILVEGFNNEENSPDNKFIRSNLCEGNPVIIKFKSNTGIKQHFMLATGFTVNREGELIYVLNNPGSNSGDNIVQDGDEFKESYPYILGFSLYRPSSDPSMMTITAPMNVHFVIIDPLGRKTGYDPSTDTHYKEIPGASYGDQVINTPEESEESEILVAERYYSSPKDNPEGRYQITTRAIESGDYYLDIRTTDAEGYANDAHLKTGVLAMGQSETTSLSHTHEAAPLITADLKISNYIINLRSKGFLDVGMIFGGRLKSFSKSKLTLKEKFEFQIGGVNGYRLSIPASQFKSLKILNKKIYTYITKNVTIMLLESGDFEVIMDKSNLQSIPQDKMGYITISVDSISGGNTVTLKCNKKVCRK